MPGVSLRLRLLCLFLVQKQPPVAVLAVALDYWTTYPLGTIHSAAHWDQFQIGRAEQASGFRRTAFTNNPHVVVLHVDQLVHALSRGSPCIPNNPLLQSASSTRAASKRDAACSDFWVLVGALGDHSRLYLETMGSGVWVMENADDIGWKHQ